MVGRRNLRKRTSQANCQYLEETPEKKIKSEKEEFPVEALDEPAEAKQPIIAPNGKIFYPCQYCTKVFPQKTTSITHMKKCPKKKLSSIQNIALNKNEPNINNNSVELSSESENRNINDNNSNIEPNLTEPKIKISQNIAVKAAETEKPQHMQAVDPSSVYDYDEQDDDKPEENNEDVANNRLCKHCKTLFDNPLDLLRHTRDCHNFPRTILPPDEIEKYFDSPNREFCPICEKPIKTRNFRSVFIKHLLVHTAGLTHECGICKKKFRRRDHMRAHEKRHIVSV